MCYKCIHPCENCSSATECTTCIDGENRLDIDGDCLCAEGYKEYEGKCMKICGDGYYENYDNCVKCHP